METDLHDERDLPGIPPVRVNRVVPGAAFTLPVGGVVVPVFHDLRGARSLGFRIWYLGERRANTKRQTPCLLVHFAPLMHPTEAIRPGDSPEWGLIGRVYRPHQLSVNSRLRTGSGKGCR
jgi:hypothetical protein